MSIPETIGQLCIIRAALADEDPNEVYLVIEDPSVFDDNDTIYVVSLKELQRNVHHPLDTGQVAVTKSDLLVIADSLEDYARLLNEQV
jgi:hypothetical protein